MASTNNRSTTGTFVIVDDHRAVADIVGYALQTKLPVTCVGRFYSVEEAKIKLPSLSPKVVIMDWWIGQKSSLSLIRDLKIEMPAVKWLLFTAWPTSSVLSEMLSAGIDGCVSKSSDYQELSTALDKLLKGDRHFCQESLKSLGRGEPRAASDFDLNQKEREIIRLIAAGLEVKEISNQLNISSKTVHNYLVLMRRKLGLCSMVEIANFATAHGFAPPR